MGRADIEHQQKLKGLMWFRVLFGFILCASTIFYRMTKTPSPTPLTVLIILGLTALILLLSIFYFAIYRFLKNTTLFSYAQLAVDTVIITLIIMVTGIFSSVFTFMYLVIIMCSAMLLLRKGSLIIATLCAVQYAAIITLEFNGYFELFSMEENLARIGLMYVVYKVAAIVSACYAVALLVSFLAERERSARSELEAVEAHLKRVEKTAAIGEMAAGLAHEIKNPLASLTGAIQLLREDMETSAEKMKLMQIVLREADRLSTLVTDFLLYAKPKTGTPKLIQMESAIHETVAFFEHDHKCRGKVEFRTNTIPDIWIKMDPGQFRQVLLNLFLNAVQAISDHGVITINMKSPKREQVVVEIIDDGRGMDEKTQKVIFDPFFTTRQDGTGLGLAIVHRILSDYDSQLDVHSQVGEGTRFTITFKRVAPPPDSTLT